jgi:hypothetical protein
MVVKNFLVCFGLSQQNYSYNEKRGFIDARALQKSKYVFGHDNNQICMEKETLT